MRFNAVLSLLTITTAASVLLTACGAKEKEVSFQSGGMTHKMTAGESVDTKAFPLPVYPGAEPTGAVSANQADENSSFMMLSSVDKMDKVESFYTEKLKAEGWTVNATTPMQNAVNISISKKDMEGNVMLGVDGDKTTITLAVSKESADPAKMTTETYTPDKLNPPTD